MRVLIVSHTYISLINRKKWQVAADLYPETQFTILFPTKWRTTLFNHESEKSLTQHNSSSCRFIALDTFKSGNEVLYGYKTLHLFNLIRKIKPDLIHVEQGDNALSYFQCIIFSKILRLNPKFIFFTWVNWKEKKSLKYQIFWNWIEKFNLNKSSAAITGNLDAEKILREKGFQKKILVLPQLGVDTDIFKPAQKITSKFNLIGFVGRLVEEKGIFTLLDAFANLHKNYPEWNLAYLGSGPCKEVLRNRILEKKLESCVEIQETVPHNQVVQFIQKLDIFVLPSFDKESWREQFGHVLIEAMACKVPIIGSDAGEIPNIISNVGIIFKQKNTNSLQNALERLIQNEKLRKELGEKGYLLALNDYSHKSVANKTYAFWNQIMKGN